MWSSESETLERPVEASQFHEKRIKRSLACPREHYRTMYITTPLAKYRRQHRTSNREPISTEVWVKRTHGQKIVHERQTHTSSTPVDKPRLLSLLRSSKICAHNAAQPVPSQPSPIPKMPQDSLISALHHRPCQPSVRPPSCAVPSPPRATP